MAFPLPSQQPRNVRLRLVQNLFPLALPTLPEGFTLRPYQQEACDQAIAWIAQGRRRMIGEIPPGGGKTVVFAHIARAVLHIRQTTRRRVSQKLEQPGHVLYIVPGLNLIRQVQKQFSRFFQPDDLGMIQAATNELGSRVTIASLDTIANPVRLRQFLESLREPLALILVDEADSNFEAVKRLLEAIDPTRQIPVIGMTGTMFRGDKKNLGEIYTDGVFFSIDPRLLHAQNFLIKPESYTVDTNLDLTAEEFEALLFAQKSQDAATARRLEQKLLQSNRYEQAFQAYQQRFTLENKVLIFAQSVSDMHNYVGYFRERGIEVRSEDAHTPLHVREQIARDFLPGGPVQVIVNFHVLLVGVDIPHLRGVIMDSWMSERQWYQAIGRVARIDLESGKDGAIVILLVDQGYKIRSRGALEETPEQRERALIARMAGEKPEKSSAPNDYTRSEQGELVATEYFLSRAELVVTDLFAGYPYTIDPRSGQLSLLAEALGELRTSGDPQQGYLVYFKGFGQEKSQRITIERKPLYEALEQARRYLVSLQKSEYWETYYREHGEEPLTESQYTYLSQRKVGNLGQNLEEAREKGVKQKHFKLAYALLEQHKTSDVPGMGRLTYDEVGQKFVFKWHPPVAKTRQRKTARRQLSAKKTSSSCEKPGDRRER